MLPSGVSPVSAPVVNPALGSDLAGTNDLLPNMAECAGRTALIQACVRRLITPRGGLIYDPNYGYDLTQFINADLSQTDAAAIAPNITAELLKDQRVLSCTTTLQWVGISQVQAAMTGTVANPQPIPLGALVIAIQMQDNQGPFTLILAASAVTVSVLQVSGS